MAETQETALSIGRSLLRHVKYTPGNHRKVRYYFLKDICGMELLNEKLTLTLVSGKEIMLMTAGLSEETFDGFVAEWAKVKGVG